MLKLHWAIMRTLETKKIKNKKPQQRKTFNKETDVEKNQMKVLELKIQ